MVEKIYKKNKLVIIDRLDFQNKITLKSRNIKIYKKDIIDLKSLIKLSKNCKFVFHLAANVGVDNVGNNPIKNYGRGVHNSKKYNQSYSLIILKI